MAKRLSNKQKEEIVSKFRDGNSVDQIAEEFDCTKLTISRNLKKNIGENEFKSLNKKIFSSNKDKDLKAERNEVLTQMVLDLERQVLLKVNDNLWKDHLLSMDHLREGIGLVGYAQKKPLDEYRKQAFEMFTDLMHRIDLEAVGTFFKLTIANPLVEVESKKPAVDD